MPELLEVESFRRIADRVLVGGRIEKVWAAQDRIVISGVAPRTLARKLKGRHVLDTDRRGKYAWLVLDRPPHPVFHFGMTGRFEELQRSAPRNRYVKLDLTTTTGGRLVYDNRRRLGRIRLVDNPAAGGARRGGSHHLVPDDSRDSRRGAERPRLLHRQMALQMRTGTRSTRGNGRPL